MLKRLGRFSLLILLSAVLVYAPEILSSVSPPYSIAAPQRTLLRIALCFPSTPEFLNTAISAYQKQYPSVHLRITRLSEEQLHTISPPYPEIILYAPSSEVTLPKDFASVQINHASLHAAIPAPTASEAAEAFTAYINEAISALPGNL